MSNWNITVPKITVKSFVKTASCKAPGEPVISLPEFSNRKEGGILNEMDLGYKKGYKDGWDESTDLSLNKEQENDYWIGYSCGHRDGTLDRENGRPYNNF